MNSLSFISIRRFLLLSVILVLSFDCGYVLGQAQTVNLGWLCKEVPSFSTGVSWGVPFRRGMVGSENFFILRDRDNMEMPLQSWPLAYWPDGSLKWVGFSTVVNDTPVDHYFLTAVKEKRTGNVNQRVSIREDSDIISVRTGDLECEIPREGKELIQLIKVKNVTVSSGGRLICLLQKGSAKEVGKQPDIEKYIGKTDRVEIEQRGPVRSVIKIEGKHQSGGRGRSWLPFCVRLYFYAGQSTIKMVHTIIYDGDDCQDFIRGLGLQFDVPLREQLYNRHIRFTGQDGHFWDEPVQPLNGRFDLSQSEDFYAKQLAGKRIPEPDYFDGRQRFLIHHWASWNDFRLTQLNAGDFVIKKRTNASSAWIKGGTGKRSKGLVFGGDVSGGLAVCLRNFWQSYPSELEVRDARSDTARIQAWLWSPEAPAMDLRHYDTIPYGHNLLASYEDVQPGFSTPNGVARTSEILLFPTSELPTLDELNNISKLSENPPLLTADPSYYYNIPVFGIWSLPDSSSIIKQRIEQDLDKAIELYEMEVDQRSWYGFWDFGDVMHSYDARRHVWKYDIGGFAWDNTELMPNLWLWYSYLRSGRADIFRMAEAMTRHTSEVDVYHSGRFKGLGSRHNVRHWGGGAKEVRISQAFPLRFYYYLTTDERTGDLMEASAEYSSDAIGRTDPLRLILKKSDYPTHARVGPDWLALAGNWMTQWERTGDNTWRDKIMNGINSLSKMPYGMFSGRDGALGYNPDDNSLHQLSPSDIGFIHLSVLMGGPEVAFELTPLLNEPKWTNLWLQFAKLYGAPADSIKKEFGQSVQLGKPGVWYARLPAYYARMKDKPSWAARAWNEFLHHRINFSPEYFNTLETLEPISEVKGISTNATAQWGLNAIELLELIGDQIPDNPGIFK